MILAYMQFFDRETWRFVNSFAPWFAELGTFTAALTALYLAHRHARISLRIEASVELRHESDESDESDEFVSYAIMEVVNDGPRDVTITEAYWEFSGDKRIDGVNLSNSSDALPARRRDGDAVSFQFEHLDRILSAFDGAVRVKAVVQTSTGKEFSAWLPRTTLQEAKEAVEFGIACSVNLYYYRFEWLSLPLHLVGSGRALCCEFCPQIGHKCAIIISAKQPPGLISSRLRASVLLLRMAPGSASTAADWASL